MIIKDKCLGNYEVDVSDSYTLRLNTGKTAFDKKSQKDVPVYDVQGYFSTLEGALMKAAKLLTLEQCGDVVTLKEYIQTLEGIWNDIKTNVKV